MPSTHFYPMVPFFSCKQKRHLFPCLFKSPLPHSVPLMDLKDPLWKDETLLGKGEDRLQVYSGLENKTEAVFKMIIQREHSASERPGTRSACDMYLPGLTIIVQEVTYAVCAK